jgi:Zn-finger nucleic acid-binding protein
MWVRQAVLKRLFAEEERGAVSMGPAVLAHQVQRLPAETVRYVPCPECGKVMNRINFAKRSGVVLDSCAAHGTWFDADELRRVVEFIRSGGVEQVRTRERMYLEETRRALLLKQRAGDPASHATISHDDAGSPLRTSALECMLYLFGER